MEQDKQKPALRIDLRDPEHITLIGLYKPGDGSAVKVKFDVRVFTLDDIGWLAARTDKDWWVECEMGNIELLLDILAHQVDNASEVEGHFDDLPLREALAKFVPNGARQQRGIMMALADAYENSMPREQFKKKAKRAMSTYSTLLLLGCCIGVAASLIWARF